MQHEDYRNMFESYLSGELSRDEEKRLLAHLDECPECAKEWNDTKKMEERLVRALMASAKGFHKPPAIPVTDMLAVGAGNSQIRPRDYRRTRNTAFFSILAAGVIIALALMVYFVVTNSADKLSDNARARISDMLENPGSLEILSPEDATSTAGTSTARSYDYLHTGQKDPWGRPYKVVRAETGDILTIYSFGPNGRDESCSGDDVFLAPAEMPSPISE